MKKVSLLFFSLLLAYVTHYGQSTWDNFENTRLGFYDFSHGALNTYVGNPDKTGNTSEVVASYKRNAGIQFDVIVIDAPSVLENVADYLTDTKQMMLDVWSSIPAGVTVQITLEDTTRATNVNFPTGRHSVYLATTTTDSAWETLTFAYNNRPDATVPDTTVNRIVLLFNPDSFTDESYFFDNLVGPSFAMNPCMGVMPADTILNDFECNQNSNITFSHGGTSLRRIPNPDPSGANNSSYVGSYSRNPGEEFDVIVGTFPGGLALGDSNIFRLSVWDSAGPTDVKISLQYTDGTVTNDIAGVQIPTVGNSQWEVMEFSFGDLSDTTINAFVILFDPGNFTNDTYFFDDFSFEAITVMDTMPMSNGPALWDNFEDTRKVYYSFTHGTFVPYTGNPDTVGNPSPVVAKYTRNAAETFDVILLDGTAPFEDLSPYLNNSQQMTVDVWSPASGTQVQITLEDTFLAKAANFPTGRHSVYLATTSVDSAWETLTFSYDNRPDGSVSNTTANRMVLLFNPNSNTDDTYYFDNVVGPAFAPDPCEGVTPSDSILNDFECNQHAFVSFNHGQSLRRIPNPDASGANTSDFVASYTRNPGEEFDVIVGGFQQPLMLEDTNAIRLMVWDGGAPTEVRLALQYNNGDSTVEVAAVSANTSTASQWEELEFRFGDLSDTTVNAFVLLFDPGDFTSDTYFFDNMSVVTGQDLVGIEDYLEKGQFTVYPNPTAGVTQFSYELKTSANIAINIFDLAGRKMAMISEGVQAAGTHLSTWNASTLPNGLYLYNFRVNNQIISGKILVSHN